MKISGSTLFYKYEVMLKLFTLEFIIMEYKEIDGILL